jgi:hypothetical protein
VALHSTIYQRSLVFKTKDDSRTDFLFKLHGQPYLTIMLS